MRSPESNSGKDVTEQLVSMFEKDGVKIPDLVGVNLDVSLTYRLTVTGVC